MPNFPELSASLKEIKGGTFADFASRMAELKETGKLLPLHLGDSYLLPPKEALEAVDQHDLQTHVYAPVPGLPELREAIAGKHETAYENVFVTTGITGGLNMLSHALFSPTEEVLVITPSWPLIFGILSSAHLKPVQVPISENGWPDKHPNALLKNLEAHLSPKTKGLYFSQPNNPAGFVLNDTYLKTLAEFVAKHQLWLLVDEAYRDLLYGESSQIPNVYSSEHPLECIQKQTFRFCSFSKSYAMAGHRIGYVLGHENSRQAIHKMRTHHCYQAPVSGQKMAIAALQTSPLYLNEMRQQYKSLRDLSVSALKDIIPFRVSDAAYYLFLDLRQQLTSKKELDDLLLRLLDDGVTLARGSVFGKDFECFARLCFSALPEGKLTQALSIVKTHLKTRL
ncbi:MAG: pyridoxal phosphate-dependent aminotransferase [Myxococcota bacterium]|nr:pyridoxal phosphate-dependent aminotransferase [Myxococcota bacterium]